MAISVGEQVALKNLSSKARGEDVGWINIAAAQALTLAGLAERDRQGWRITPAGSAALDSTTPKPATILAMQGPA